MRVVLDTNVIVSGLNFPGNERLVLELALRGRFELFLSNFILGEVEGVLQRKFGWDEARTRQAVRTLRVAATLTVESQLPGRLEGGRADDHILACAAAASADYLVTGDRRHLLPLVQYEGTSILSAPRFLSALDA